ncbi:uncharacterized protein B0H18DRAFT_1126614 [Fomitopsis serialis]|uniref:uncharacterized protein n=1 Tax=Fomitopsis serialis TaxID=139415 RepID=UPI002008630D|nr:uncharacterized protein B0H18DRAFT_1126614 [Neoantrodia serialis]KAH9913036.1 hypothetical protein B0H18DRAFT_1126614 [Neoantrodia serialis]
MVRLDQRVLRLLAPALPSYGITAHYAQECPENPEINHITVVCLERKNFGVLFDYGQASKVVVETMLYVLDRHPPLSLPLIWDVLDNEIEISFNQPLTTQLLRGLNEWKSHEQPLGMSFDLFSVDANAFIPACLHAVPFRLPFPLKHVPVFKESNVALTEDAGDYSRGLKPLVPMCSMTASFMAFDFVWPMDVPNATNRASTSRQAVANRRRPQIVLGKTRQELYWHTCSKQTTTTKSCSGRRGKN